MNFSQIIDECINGNSSSQKLFYLHFAQHIYGIAKRYSVDDAQAEDYMQESFVKIFDKLDMYDSNKGNIKAWISRVTVNTIISDIRKQSKRKEDLTDFSDFNSFEMESEDTMENIFQEEIEAKALLSAIRQLPEKYSTVLNLFIFENLSHKEVAAILDIEPSSSRSRFVRAKKMLKKILTNHLITIG